MEIGGIGLTERPQCLERVDRLTDQHRRRTGCAALAARFEGGQRSHQLGHRAVPVVRVLGGGSSHDLVDPRRCTGDDRRGQRYRVLQLALDDLGLRWHVDEREPARRRLEQGDPEPVHVGAGVERLPSELLGRGVGGRPGRQRGDQLIVAGAREGDPEVGEVEVPLGVEHHVGRLDVTVDHAGTVGGVQRRTDLLDHPSQLNVIEAFREHRRFERPARHQPHHEVGVVGLAPVVVERHDEWMLEGGHRLRLGLEAPDETRLVGEFSADLLDRHLPTECRLDPAPHQRERPFADQLDELIAAQGTRAARQRWVVAGDLAVELEQRRRRVEPDFFHEQIAEVVELAQCLGLPPGRVQRSHQQCRGRSRSGSA